MGRKPAYATLEKRVRQLEKKNIAVEKENIRLEKKIISLEKQNIRYEKQAEKKAFAEKLTRTLFEISSAVNTTIDLEELYLSIYKSLDRLLGLPDFYIAIHEKTTNKLHIPFFIAQFKRTTAYKDFFDEINSLSGEVISKEQPLLLNEAQIRKRALKGKITDPIPKIWLGVPLKRMDETFGVIAMQHYGEPEYFDKKDLDILISISNQIALAIERKQSLKELDVLRENLSGIINSMPSIIIGLNRNNRVTQWNDQAEMETGISSNSAKGRTLEEVFPRLALNMLKIEKSIKSNKIQTIMKQEYFSGKERRYEDIIIYPLAINGEEGVVIRLDEVTDQVRLKEMMIQSEKMLSIGGLAAGMAHEINNPLAGMMQNAQVVRNRLTRNIPANNKAAQELGISMQAIRAYMKKREILPKLDMIHDVGNRAARIVSNMLGFVRKNDSMIEPQDLSGILRETVELVKNDYSLKKRYNMKRIHIIEKFDPIPPIKCDKGKIEQVLFNVIKNGAEAMFEVENSSFPPQFIFRVYREGKMACIDIEDNGPGIDEES